MFFWPCIIVYTFQNTNLVHNSLNIQQYICYITLLNMFRAARCSSSLGPILSPQPLVSSPWKVLYNGHRVSLPGVTRRDVALVTQPLLALRLRISWSYNSASPLYRHSHFIVWPLSSTTSKTLSWQEMLITPPEFCSLQTHCHLRLIQRTAGHKNAGYKLLLSPNRLLHSDGYLSHPRWLFLSSNLTWL